MEPETTWKEENPLYRNPRGDSNPRCCITEDSEPNTLPTELFRPHGKPFHVSTVSSNMYGKQDYVHAVLQAYATAEY